MNADSFANPTCSEIKKNVKIRGPPAYLALLSAPAITPGFTQLGQYRVNMNMSISQQYESPQIFRKKYESG